MNVQSKRIATLTAEEEGLNPITTQAQIEFRNVTNMYGAIAAVSDLSLIVPGGEFLTILGPSGSGKTTAPMLLAGFATSPMVIFLLSVSR